MLYSVFFVVFRGREALFFVCFYFMTSCFVSLGIANAFPFSDSTAPRTHALPHPQGSNPSLTFWTTLPIRLRFFTIISLNLREFGHVIMRNHL